MGATITFRVRAPHKTNSYEGKPIYSLPVTSEKTGDGEFPLNKTNMSYLVAALGDNSDKWTGASFDATALPQRNPQTKAQILSWSIIKESIKK